MKISDTEITIDFLQQFYNLAYELSFDKQGNFQLEVELAGPRHGCNMDTYPGGGYSESLTHYDWWGTHQNYNFLMATCGVHCFFTKHNHEPILLKQCNFNHIMDK